MSVQIKIERKNGTVTFTPTQDIQRSDLVFWHNYDTEPHFPIPGCDALRVKPKAKTSAFQPVSKPDQSDTTIVYHCALHKGEEGTLLIKGAAPEGGTKGSVDMTIIIDISRDDDGRVVFDETDLTQPDMVQWWNNDSVEHWPVPNCWGLRVEPGKSSSAMQPAPALPTLPFQIIYGCAIPGHENERGIMNVYKPLTMVGTAVKPVAVSIGGPAVPVLTGGKSPYPEHDLNPATPNLTLSETAPVGSCAGLSIAATGSIDGPIKLTVRDGMGGVLRLAPLFIKVT